MPTIKLDKNCLHNLDLSPIKSTVEQCLKGENIKDYEQKICFEIDYLREATDPRELSEIPEVRLWFIRLDGVYPWMPFLLDWRAGELSRYVAMLVPHQFNRTEGIQYNPEALEIFVMQKIFILHDWLKQQDIPSQYRLKSMAQMLGYELDDAFFAFIDR